MGVTYDAGALVAADRGERRVWARHRALLSLREVPTTPAPVVAQAWRGGSRQALLAWLLVGSDIEPMNDDEARSVGVLAGKAGATQTKEAVIGTWLRLWSNLLPCNEEASHARTVLANCSTRPIKGNEEMEVGR